MIKNTNQKEINDLFQGIINTIDLVFLNDFYTETNSLVDVRKIIKKWYDDFKKYNTLTNIKAKDLEFVDLEITNFFDIYITNEPMSHNYTEILSHSISVLEKYWKDEINSGIELQKIIDEMKIHLQNILIKINKLSLKKKENIDVIKKEIHKINDYLCKHSDITNIDLKIVKEISNLIYDLNFNNSFCKQTDFISNQFYAFEFLLQKYLFSIRRRICKTKTTTPIN